MATTPRFLIVALLAFYCAGGYGSNTSGTSSRDCSQDASICHRHGFCIADLKMCICETGYAGDGITCTDVNECEANDNPCKGQDGDKCVNIDGGYVCCDPLLSDDQCIAEKGAYCSGGCGPYAFCFNQTCTCMDGFQGNPKVLCEDINECENEELCPGSEEWCVNRIGSYLCCNSNSTEPECQGLSVADGNKLFYSESDAITFKGKKFTAIIEKGESQRNESGGAFILARGNESDYDSSEELLVDSDGIVFSLELPACDENSPNNATDCPNNSECTEGRCRCNSGYEYRRSTGTCLDIDECAQDPRPCSEVKGQWCVNTNGGYLCCDRFSTPSECLGLEIVPLNSKSGEGGLRSSSSDELTLHTGSKSGKWITETFGEVRNTSGGEIIITRGKIAPEGIDFESEAESSSTTEEPESGLEIVGGEINAFETVPDDGDESGGEHESEEVVHGEEDLSSHERESHSQEQKIPRTTTVNPDFDLSSTTVLSGESSTISTVKVDGHSFPVGSNGISKSGVFETVSGSSSKSKNGSRATIIKGTGFVDGNAAPDVQQPVSGKSTTIPDLQNTMKVDGQVFTFTEAPKVHVDGGDGVTDAEDAEGFSTSEPEDLVTGTTVAKKVAVEKVTEASITTAGPGSTTEDTVMVDEKAFKFTNIGEASTVSGISETDEPAESTKKPDVNVSTAAATATTPKSDTTVASTPAASKTTAAGKEATSEEHPEAESPDVPEVDLYSGETADVNAEKPLAKQSKTTKKPVTSTTTSTKAGSGKDGNDKADPKVDADENSSNVPVSSKEPLSPTNPPTSNKKSNGTATSPGVSPLDGDDNASSITSVNPNVESDSKEAVTSGEPSNNTGTEGFEVGITMPFRTTTTTTKPRKPASTTTKRPTPSTTKKPLSMPNIKVTTGLEIIPDSEASEEFNLVAEVKMQSTTNKPKPIDENEPVDDSEETFDLMAGVTMVNSPASTTKKTGEDQTLTDHTTLAQTPAQPVSTTEKPKMKIEMKFVDRHTTTTTTTTTPQSITATSNVTEATEDVSTAQPDDKIDHSTTVSSENTAIVDASKTSTSAATSLTESSTVASENPATTESSLTSQTVTEATSEETSFFTTVANTIKSTFASISGSTVDEDQVENATATVSHTTVTLSELSSSTLSVNESEIISELTTESSTSVSADLGTLSENLTLSTTAPSNNESDFESAVTTEEPALRVTNPTDAVSSASAPTDVGDETTAVGDKLGRTGATSGSSTPKSATTDVPEGITNEPSTVSSISTAKGSTSPSPVDLEEQLSTTAVEPNTTVSELPSAKISDKATSSTGSVETATITAAVSTTDKSSSGSETTTTANENATTEEPANTTDSGHPDLLAGLPRTTTTTVLPTESGLTLSSTEATTNQKATVGTTFESPKTESTTSPDVSGKLADKLIEKQVTQAPEETDTTTPEASTTPSGSDLDKSPSTTKQPGLEITSENPEETGNTTVEETGKFDGSTTNLPESAGSTTVVELTKTTAKGNVGSTPDDVVSSTSSSSTEAPDATTPPSLIQSVMNKIKETFAGPTEENEPITEANETSTTVSENIPNSAVTGEPTEKASETTTLSVFSATLVPSTVEESDNVTTNAPASKSVTASPASSTPGGDTDKTSTTISLDSSELNGLEISAVDLNGSPDDTTDTSETTTVASSPVSKTTSSVISESTPSVVDKSIIETTKTSTPKTTESQETTTVGSNSETESSEKPEISTTALPIDESTSAGGTTVDAIVSTSTKVPKSTHSKETLLMEKNETEPIETAFPNGTEISPPTSSPEASSSTTIVLTVSSTPSELATTVSDLDVAQQTKHTTAGTEASQTSASPSSESSSAPLTTAAEGPVDNSTESATLPSLETSAPSKIDSNGLGSTSVVPETSQATVTEVTPSAPSTATKSVNAPTTPLPDDASSETNTTVPDSSETDDSHASPATTTATVPHLEASLLTTAATVISETTGKPSEEDSSVLPTTVADRSTSGGPIESTTASAKPNSVKPLAENAGEIGSTTVTSESGTTAFTERVLSASASGPAGVLTTSLPDIETSNTVPDSDESEEFELTGNVKFGTTTLPNESGQLTSTLSTVVSEVTTGNKENSGKSPTSTASPELTASTSSNNAVNGATTKDSGSVTDKLTATTEESAETTTVASTTAAGKSTPDQPLTESELKTTEAKSATPTVTATTDSSDSTTSTKKLASHEAFAGRPETEADLAPPENSTGTLTTSVPDESNATTPSSETSPANSKSSVHPDDSDLTTASGLSDKTTEASVTVTVLPALTTTPTSNDTDTNGLEIRPDNADSAESGSNLTTLAAATELTTVSSESLSTTTVPTSDATVEEKVSTSAQTTTTGIPGTTATTGKNERKTTVAPSEQTTEDAPRSSTNVGVTENVPEATNATSVRPDETDFSSVSPDSATTTTAETVGKASPTSLVSSSGPGSDSEVTTPESVTESTKTTESVSTGDKKITPPPSSTSPVVTDASTVAVDVTSTPVDSESEPKVTTLHGVTPEVKTSTSSTSTPDHTGLEISATDLEKEPASTAESAHTTLTTESATKETSEAAKLTTPSGQVATVETSKPISTIAVEVEGTESTLQSQFTVLPEIEVTEKNLAQTTTSATTEEPDDSDLLLPVKSVSTDSPKTNVEASTSVPESTLTTTVAESSSSLAPNVSETKESTPPVKEGKLEELDESKTPPATTVSTGTESEKATSAESKSSTPIQSTPSDKDVARASSTATPITESTVAATLPSSTVKVNDTEGDGLQILPETELAKRPELEADLASSENVVTTGSSVLTSELTTVSPKSETSATTPSESTTLPNVSQATSSTGTPSVENVTSKSESSLLPDTTTIPELKSGLLPEDLAESAETTTSIEKTSVVVTTPIASTDSAETTTPGTTSNVTPTNASSTPSPDESDINGLEIKPESEDSTEDGTETSTGSLLTTEATIKASNESSTGTTAESLPSTEAVTEKPVIEISPASEKTTTPMVTTVETTSAVTSTPASEGVTETAGIELEKLIGQSTKPSAGVSVESSTSKTEATTAELETKTKTIDLTTTKPVESTPKLDATTTERTVVTDTDSTVQSSTLKSVTTPVDESASITDGLEIRFESGATTSSPSSTFDHSDVSTVVQTTTEANTEEAKGESTKPTTSKFPEPSTLDVTEGLEIVGENETTTPSSAESASITPAVATTEQTGSEKPSTIEIETTTTSVTSKSDSENNSTASVPETSTLPFAKQSHELRHSAEIRTRPVSSESQEGETTFGSPSTTTVSNHEVDIDDESTESENVTSTATIGKSTTPVSSSASISSSSPSVPLSTTESLSESSVRTALTTEAPAPGETTTSSSSLGEGETAQTTVATTDTSVSGGFPKIKTTHKLIEEPWGKATTASTDKFTGVESSTIASETASTLASSTTDLHFEAFSTTPQPSQLSTDATEWLLSTKSGEIVGSGEAGLEISVVPEGGSTESSTSAERHVSSTEVGLEISGIDLITTKEPTTAAVNLTLATEAPDASISAATTSNPDTVIETDGNENLTFEEIERIKAAKAPGSTVSGTETGGPTSTVSPSSTVTGKSTSTVPASSTATSVPATTEDLSRPKSGEQGLELSGTGFGENSAEKTTTPADNTEATGTPSSGSSSTASASTTPEGEVTTGSSPAAVSETSTATSATTALPGSTNSEVTSVSTASSTPVSSTTPAEDLSKPKSGEEGLELSGSNLGGKSTETTPTTGSESTTSQSASTPITTENPGTPKPGEQGLELSGGDLGGKSSETTTVGSEGSSSTTSQGTSTPSTTENPGTPKPGEQGLELSGNGFGGEQTTTPTESNENTTATPETSTEATSTTEQLGLELSGHGVPGEPKTTETGLEIGPTESGTVESTTSSTGSTEQSTTFESTSVSTTESTPEVDTTSESTSIVPSSTAETPETTEETTESSESVSSTTEPTSTDASTAESTTPSSTSGSTGFSESNATFETDSTTPESTTSTSEATESSTASTSESTVESTPFSTETTESTTVDASTSTTEATDESESTPSTSAETTESTTAEQSTTTVEATTAATSASTSSEATESTSTAAETVSSTESSASPVSTTEASTTTQKAASTSASAEISAPTEPSSLSTASPTPATSTVAEPSSSTPSTTESQTAASSSSVSTTEAPVQTSVAPSVIVDESEKEESETETEELTTTTLQETLAPLTATLPSINVSKCLSSNECGNDADCERRSGACRCKPGFRGNPPHEPCKDVDECKEETNDCNASSRCLNYVGGYQCVCAIGYRKNAEHGCVDIDECKESNGTLCDRNAVCRNLPGAYLCECNAGYTGDGYACINIEKRHCTHEEWARSDCGRNHHCLVDGHGVVDCDTCKAGFTKKHGICSDIDECEEHAQACHADAVCRNTMGGYLCQCQPGYAGDGHNCIDIDECAAGNNGCHPQATCINTLGSYTCQCPEGWTGDGFTACLNPIDQTCAQRSDFCQTKGGNNSACLSVSVGSSLQSVCECLPNYRLNAASGECEDIDECLENRDNCDTATTTCVNTPGSFLCNCASGYEGLNGVCVDIDECQRGTAGCHVNAHCINRIGGVECRCAAGFTGDGTDCIAVDGRHAVAGNNCNEDWVHMCRSLNKTCHIDDEEVPQCGSCLFGFQPMDGKCLPINAVGNCADPNKNDCDVNAECIDVRPGRHFCSCKVGYIGDGMHCDDVDECSIPRLCDAHATCLNTNGSYECHCKEGFAGNGFKCVLATHSQNCRINPQICHENAGCQPDGTCKCLRNFEGDGVSACDAVSESNTTKHALETTTSGRSTYSTESPFLTTTTDSTRCSEHDRTACHVLATCDVDAGECVCRQGFMGDGYISCTRMWEDCTVDETMCHANATCDRASRQCICNLGHIGDGISCVPDKMDCVVRGNLCSDLAQCVARRCVCGPGYTGDGSICMPLEPPAEAFGNCSACHSHATCVNSNLCSCNQGCFGNGVMCVPDPQDCVNYPGVCHMNGFCDTGSRRCSCKKGFLGNGLDCSRRISCTSDASICHAEAKCLSDGRCECNEGLLGDGVECHKAITASEIFGTSAPQLVHFECESDCGINAECINGACKCQTGFLVNHNAQCEDIDECKMKTSTCHANARCINTEGSYECRCNDGFLGDGRDCYQPQQNAPVGTDGLEIECRDDGMNVLLTEEVQPFTGRVFVRGQSENPYCTKTFTAATANETILSFFIPLAHCDMQLEANETLAVTVVVQKHSTFITEKAYAYRLRCTYPTATRMIMAHYNVSDITTAETIREQGAAPQCQLTVTNEEDTTIDSAIVGQLLKLTLFIEPNETFTVVPRNCYAINLETSERYALTDEAGCAVDEQLFPEWTRVRPSLTTAAFSTFKWPDSSMIRFECDCAACLDECPQINCERRRQVIQRRAKMRFARDHDSVFFDPTEMDAELERELQLIKNLQLAESPTTAYSSVVAVADNVEERMAQKQMEQWLAKGNANEETSFFANLDEERVCIGTPWAAICLLSVLFSFSLLVTMTRIYHKRVKAPAIPDANTLAADANSDASSAYIKF